MGPGWPLLGESCQPSGSCTAVVTLTPIQVAPLQWGDGPKNPSPDVQEGALRAEQSFPGSLGSRCRGQGLYAQTVPKKPAPYLPIRPSSGYGDPGEPPSSGLQAWAC